MLSENMSDADGEGKREGSPHSPIPSPVPVEPPKESISDKSKVLLRRGVEGIIPVVGPIVAELLGWIVGDNLAKRRDAWIADVGTRLHRLEAQGSISSDALAEDQAFSTTFLQATQTAIRTHHQAKLEALRNAVVNSALDIEPDDSVRQVFIEYIDQMTPVHLRVLAFYHDPAGWFPPNHGIRKRPLRSAVEPLRLAVPELETKTGMINHFIEDLQSKGLLDEAPLEVTRRNHALRKRTTELGDRFIAFVTDRSEETGVDKEAASSEDVPASGEGADEN